MAHSTALRTTAALIVLASSTVQTVAGGYARECYRQVHAAPVYETVYEKVLVEPGRKHVEVIPAVYGTERRRVLVRAAETRWRIVPAEYATVKEKVLVEPARTVERVIPAVTKTVHRKVKVHDGGYAWEWRWIKGEKVLCKVKRHAVYKTVAETVVVRDQRVTRAGQPVEQRGLAYIGAPDQGNDRQHGNSQREGRRTAVNSPPSPCTYRTPSTTCIPVVIGSLPARVRATRLPFS